MNKSEHEIFFERQADQQLEWAREDLATSKNFTYEGLLELHAKTFTDDYNHSTEVSDYFAEYDRVREYDPYGAWSKNRYIEGYGYSLSIYSNMCAQDIERVRGAIADCQPENLKELSFYDKTEKLANLYKEIDYLHSFAEGNSRVNRVFIGEVANAAGVKIDWNQVDRREMYIARDKALAQSALKYRGDELAAMSDGRNFVDDILKRNHQQLSSQYPTTTLNKVVRNASTDIQSLKQQQTQDIKPRQRLK